MKKVPERFHPEEGPRVLRRFLSVAHDRPEMVRELRGVELRVSLTTPIPSLTAAVLMAALSSPAFSQSTEAGAADRYFAALSGLCGKAFAGKIVANEPKPTTPDAFEGKVLIFHARRCEKDRLELPFHVGEDRSRTWVLTRKEGAILLKHDHRHKDGSPDALTMYGGFTLKPGTAARQEFPADADTKALFTKLNLPVSIPNVWAMEIEAGKRFVYELARPGRLFRVEFDLTKPVDPPPAPWGHEGK